MVSMKRVLILGSTGTIGVNTLKVVERFPHHFQVAGLTAYNNVEVLASQARIFKPKYVGISAKQKQLFLDAADGLDAAILDAEKDLAELCSLNDIDIVVIGISGRAALEPFLAAIRSGKTIAPANKEALVIAGDILMTEARLHHAKIIPVDSEQSAIFQCLEGQRRKDLKKVYLTASGGALRDVPAERFDQLTVDEILKHPRWKMGAKITVDSATMMNKGFEVIEAQRLFDLQLDQIEVVVHPEAVVHSMVCFRDGSVIAQLGVTDMRVPIQYALTYPERWSAPVEDLNFFDVSRLNFQKPDFEKFPSLSLAMEASRQGGTVPSVLNAANEIAVEAFLNHQICFTDIYRVVERVVQQHKKGSAADIEAVLQADCLAREAAARELLKVKNS